MGVSTDGQICYGILFGEGFDFPWGSNEEQWWREVNGFKPSFEIWEGNSYIGGKKPPESVINKYYNERHAWDDENPLPIQQVNYCSGDYPMYILAVPESCMSNNRGHPRNFDPANLKVTDEQKQRLMDFCGKYLKKAIEENNNNEYSEKIELEPKWYLSSYWG